MTTRVRSRDLTPGTRLRWTGATTPTRLQIAVLERRKTLAEAAIGGYPFRPGWWCEGGGGLADDVIDGPHSPWEVQPDAGYYVLMMPWHAEVRWRGSKQLSACFNRSDFADAQERAQAIADELNATETPQHSDGDG